MKEEKSSSDGSQYHRIHVCAGRDVERGWVSLAAEDRLPSDTGKCRGASGSGRSTPLR